MDDALLVGPNPLMNIAYGGVKVRVNDTQFERANELLTEFDQSNRDIDATSETDTSDDAESSQALSVSSDSEKRVRRAHAAALVGLVTLPGVVHLYALYLVLTVRDAELTNEARVLRRFTLVTSTVMVGFAMWVVAMIVAR